MYDIITIGDTTTDIFLALDEKSSLCSVDKKKMELKFNYTGKIPVKGLHRVIGGGNASNHAFGAARMGLRAAIYTIIGDDDAGEAVKNKLKKEKISTKYVETDKSNGTNLSVVIDYAGDRTIMSYHAERVYKLPNFSRTKWIYFSSIRGNHESFNEQISVYVKSKKIKLGFNPGSLQMELGADKLKPIFSAAEVVFVNKQEAKRLTKETDNVKILLKEMKKIGPAIVVITDGKNGSYCYDGKKMYYIGVMNLLIVENTGAGDAYASGFVAALINNYPIQEAMRWGVANAACVMSTAGSQSGLAGKNKVKELLTQYSDLQPQEMLE